MTIDKGEPKGTGQETSKRIEELSPAKRALLEQLRAKMAAGNSAAAGIPQLAADAVAPASFAQELLWQLDRSTPGLAAYHAGRALRLRGMLDTRVLQDALDQLVARHASLRTTFQGQDGSTPTQVIEPPRGVRIEQHNLSGTARAQQDQALSELLGKFARKPFDLGREPQFRVALVTLAPDDHVMFWLGHHVSVDGWSFDVLVREFAHLYASRASGKTPSLPTIGNSYADYAAWQRNRLEGDHLASLLDYWRNQLAGAPDELPLPTDWPRPARPSFEGGQRTIVLPPELLERLKRTATESGGTLYTLLVSAYVSLLSRYSGLDDIVIGSPTAGRTRVETEGIVGYLANTLVLRVNLSGDPAFKNVMARVRDTWLGAVEHQDIPLEKLVLELRRDRIGHAPLFQCTLTMEGSAPTDVGTITDSLSMEAIELDSSLEGSAKFDLLLLVAERPDGLRLLLQYRADLFSAATAERMLGHLRSMLVSVAEDTTQRVSRLPLMSASENAAIAAWSVGPAMTPSTSTMTDLIQSAAGHTPEARAVVCNDESLTYAELESRSNRLANHLRSLGIERGSAVGLALPRSTDAIVALLGILKAGASYVPLAPDAPAQRIAQQIAEARVRLVVSNEASRRALGDVQVVSLNGDATAISSAAATRPSSGATSEDVAYVLFTSGSTGTPKGVEVTHGNLVNYTRAVSRVLAGVSAADRGDGLETLRGWRFALASTFAADLGNTSVFPALAAGGTLHVLDDATTTDAARFAERLSREPVDVLKITPNHLKALAGDRNGKDLGAVLPKRWIVTGGEALSLDFATRLLSAGTCRVLNHYGPTEATVGAATFEVTSDSLAEVRAAGAQTVPVGRPLANVQFDVLDKNGATVPVGVSGELFIAGAGVARGYAHRNELTSERFVNGSHGRAYRTGDVVRWLANGSVEFQGRADDQVKVRGYRVELGEVRHALAQHPAVGDCAVVLKKTEDGDALLVAYVVPKAGGYAAAHAEHVTPERLTAFASERLPEHAVPQAVMLLERLPLTANGKLDRAALPMPAQSKAATESIAPRTPTEQALAQIWTEVLKVNDVGVTDDFLKLGGHSLLAIRILGKISKTLGCRLPLRVLFDSPTIEQLAIQIDQARDARASVPTGA